jgi:hypothetical protein
MMDDSQDMPEGIEDQPLEGEEFEDFDVASELSIGIRTMVELQQQQLQLMAALVDQLSRPKRVIKDEAGRVIGVARE